MLFRLTSGKVVSSECAITNVDEGRSSVTSCCFILFFAVISVRLWPCVKLRLQSEILGQHCHFWKYAWFIVCQDAKASCYSEPDLCVMIRSQLVLTFSHCVLYIGQAYRWLPANKFCIFSQHAHLHNFLRHATQFPPPFFCWPQNVIYFLMLPFLVHKILIFRHRASSI